MNTKQLKYAVELGNLKSFQKVADTNGVSRSSVSRSIRQLQNDLNTELFIRLQKDMIPTFFGDILIRYAKEILNMEKDMKYDLSEDGKYHGTVKIGMGTSRTMSILTDVLPRFRNEYPNVAVQLHELRTNELMESLLARSLDFAVVSKTMDAAGIAFEPLIAEELVLVAPRNDELTKEKSFLSEGRNCIDIRELSDAPFALGYPGQKSRAVADAVFADLRIKPNIVFQTANNYSLAMMAYNGLAYALVPLSCTRIRNNELPHLYLKLETQPRWFVGIAFLADHEMSKAATQLKKMMQEMLGNGVLM